MRGAPLQVTVFGNQPGVLVCSPGRSLRPWFSVPEGCYALVQRFAAMKGEWESNGAWGWAIVSPYTLIVPHWHAYSVPWTCV